MNAGMMAGLLVALAPVAAPASAGAQVGAPLPPTGKWVVDYQQNMCLLSHRFGPEAAFTEIDFRPVPLGGQNEVMLLMPDSIRAPRFGQGRITLDPYEQPIPLDFVQVPLPDQPRSAARFWLDGDAAPLLANATVMTIALRNTTIRLALPPTKRALAALRTCQDNLVTSWGVDPHEQDRLAQEPQKRDAARWIRQDDYPLDAFTAGQQGTVLILWKVGLDGRAHDCRALQSSGVPSLDRASCEAIARRARYVPARDKDGSPMVTHEARKVRWELP